jgi:hypothetical protein
VRWLYEREGRWDQMAEAAHFFKRLLTADIPHIAVENPRIHKHALNIIGRRADCVVQPWMFGDFATKATGFWLRNLPNLVPTYRTKEECRIALGLPEDAKVSDFIHKAPPGPDRWKLRSTTFQGIAQAAAKQWSDHILSNS